MSKDKVARIRELNDAFRTSGLGGKFVLTNGVGSLGVETVGKSIEAVKAFDAFTTDNDPYGEHDFGSLDVEGHRLFWKIDYYDKELMHGTSDASNADVTARVLTIMLREEY